MKTSCKLLFLTIFFLFIWFAICIVGLLTVGNPHVQNILTHLFTLDVTATIGTFLIALLVAATGK